MIMARPDIVEIFRARGQVLELIGRYDDAIEDYRRILRIAEQSRAHDIEVNAFNYLASVLFEKGNVNRALRWSQKAYQNACKIHYLEGAATSLDRIGYAHYLRGDFKEALKHQYRSRKIYRVLKDRENLFKSLFYIALIWSEQGKYGHAISYYKKALARFKETNSMKNQLMCLKNIGVIHSYRGEYLKSMKCYMAALAISRHTGDKKNQAVLLSNLGALYVTLNKYSKALDCLKDALRISTEIGDLNGQGSNYNNIGDVYISIARYSEALAAYENALKTSITTGNKRRQAICHFYKGEVYHTVGGYSQASRFYRKSLALAESIGYSIIEALDVKQLGRCLMMSGNHNEALCYLEKAGMMFSKMRSKINHAEAMYDIAELHYFKKDFKTARRCLRKAVFRIKESRKEDLYILCLVLRSKLSSNSAHRIRYLKRAGDILQNLKSPESQWKVYYEEGIAQQEIGEVDAAIGCFRKCLNLIDRACRSIKQAKLQRIFRNYAIRKDAIKRLKDLDARRND